MTLLREVIHIPEQVHRGDFVLRLSEGVDDVQRTLREYVVTPQLTACFDQALGMIGAALSDGRSKATYLHGSFGSGKSHFMAVLYALLRHHPEARSIPELSNVVAQHDRWMAGRRFLLVPYHLIGATSLESAILGGYEQRVRRLHPDAPVPAGYRAEKLLDDARRFRERLGDEKFLAGLSTGAGVRNEGWGSLDAGWTAERIDAAMAARPGDPERDRLVSDLIATYFEAYTGVVRGAAEAFVDLDEGLAAISQHARDLGYDAVVLFLDELVLWLASRMADHAFVAAEVPKVAKLVEAADARRPVPLVSFVARQRDLRELVGTHLPGAEHLAFADSLKWWEDRFDVIRLEDRNLPLIAEKRVLAPVSPEARATLDEAFARVENVRPEVWDTLLGSEREAADRAAFRRTYPFSPAFMSALVALSSALQRERTALKVMVELLVEQRDELEVGQLLPVGDLFAAITRDEPATSELRPLFANARRLYRDKLRPLLLHQHGVDEDAAAHLPRDHPFRTDDRLAKTLLLSALVPEVASLKALTAQRLAALNHGTIRVPIPGQEGPVALRKVRHWAAEFGEIRVGDGENPVISVQLVGVDIDSVLAKVRHIDNVGERRRKLLELVWSTMGVPDQGTLIDTFELTWRGSSRRVELLFRNVRDPSDLPEELLRHSGDTWRLVVDFPFDDEGRNPHDDVARIEGLLERGVTGRAVCWVPAFLSRERLQDLSTLIQLDYLLAGDRFDEHASHLAAADRPVARQTLEARRSALRERLRGVLQQAYGAARPEPGQVDTSHGLHEHLLSLDPSFLPQLPVGGTLEAALQNLAEQMLTHQYPDHPNLDPEGKHAPIRLRDVKVVLEQVKKALADPERRLIVEPGLRSLLRRVCNPLQLGEMHEAPFVLSGYWRQHFRQRAAQEGILEAIPVRRLREWIDQPRPRGLERHVQNLLVAVFAAEDDRSWIRHDGVVPKPPLEAITDDLELRQQPLPDREAWDRAVERSGALFGTPPPLLRAPTAAGLAGLASDVRAKAGRYQELARRLVRALEGHAGELGLDAGASQGRLATARAARNLVEEAAGTDDDLALVGLLADVTLPAPDATVARSLSSAQGVADALEGANWILLDGLDSSPEDRRERARRVQANLRRAARHEELAEPLSPALRRAEEEASRLLVQRVTQPPPPPLRPSGRPSPSAGARTLTAAQVETVLGELQAFAAGQRAGTRIKVTWEVVDGA